MPPDYGSSTQNIVYWTALWENLCSLAESSYENFDFISIRFLLTDIIEEINLNKLENSGIKSLYRAKLQETQKNDPSLRSWNEELQAIANELNKEPRRSYLLAQCKVVYEMLFTERAYYKKLCALLKSHLLRSDYVSNILYELSKSAIIELNAFGLSFNAIRRIPSRLCPLKYDDFDPIHGPSSTQYPYRTNIEEFKAPNGNSFDEEAFEQKLSSELNSLTLENRLERLVHFGEDDKSELIRFIFPISGLKLPAGRDELPIGDVIFYNPLKKRFICEEPLPGITPRNEELFHDYLSAVVGEVASPLNACVPVEHKGDVFLDESIRKARSLIHRAFDIFRLYYASPARFEVGNSFRNCDVNGWNLGGRSRAPDSTNQITYAHSLDPSNHDGFEIFVNSGRMNSEASDSERKIFQALRWFRKAIETTVPEDKLLSYWIAIEGIFSKKWPGSSILKPDETEIDLIREFVPYCGLREYIHSEYIKSIWFLLDDAIINRSITLPKEILARLPLEGASPSPKVRLTQQELVNLLPSILTAIGNQSPFLSEKLIDIIRFYSNKDHDYMENQIQRFLAIAKDNLSIAYSYRNRIVHNSNIERSFLSYIVKVIHRLSGALLRMLLLGLKGPSVRTIDSILLSVQFKINTFQSKLKAKAPFNLWEIRLDP